ncbi:MAG: ABC transporter substrate-binding protein [Alphaproteobacteria bacterium]
MFRKTCLAACAALLFVAPLASAKDFRFAFQADANSMDPYNVNESFTLGFQGNIYEGLIARGPDIQIEPSLATEWEVLEPTRWRFKLREGVTFHDGRAFTADDVVFSAERVQKEGSDLKGRLTGGGVVSVTKVDDHTVDIVTAKPNPILHVEWETWAIMSKGWAEEFNATNPQAVTGSEENYATRNANGTGPFILESREVDVRTVLRVNPNWWDKANLKSNVDRVILTPIGADATRVAALLSGELDMAYPIPVQDIDRVERGASTRVLVGPELRTIYFGLDQFRDELLYSDVKGKNPFKDKRVRQALYQAIDIDAIKDKVMRGLSNPSAMMVGPGVAGFDESIQRLPFDPDASKTLLSEAGYPNGFSVTLDCPNDRYVNDEAICQATVSMLARIGVKVDLNALPRSQYFAKILAPKMETSFFLLGWTPGSYDSYNPLFLLLGCQDATGKGQFNLGRYCNPEVDALSAEILSETDDAKRNALVAQAWAKTIADVAYLPLHQQALAWGVSNKVTDIAQRGDNVFHARHVVMQ